jgi:hypothetical protein
MFVKHKPQGMFGLMLSSFCSISNQILMLGNEIILSGERTEIFSVENVDNYFGGHTSEPFIYNCPFSPLSV